MAQRVLTNMLYVDIDVGEVEPVIVPDLVGLAEIVPREAVRFLVAPRDLQQS